MAGLFAQPSCSLMCFNVPITGHCPQVPTLGGQSQGSRPRLGTHPLPSTQTGRCMACCNRCTRIGRTMSPHRSNHQRGSRLRHQTRNLYFHNRGRHMLDPWKHRQRFLCSPSAPTNSRNLHKWRIQHQQKCHCCCNLDKSSLHPGLTHSLS